MHCMKTNTPRHQSILCTDRDRVTKFFFFSHMASRNTKSSSLTLLVARVTHRASRNLTSHLPLRLPRAPQPEWWPLRPIGELSAGPVSRICSEHPPPVSVSREQTVCLARLEFLPIFPLSQTERGGSREGGEQRDAAHRRGRTTEEAGKIHLFIPALSVKSPVQFLVLRLRLSCFSPPLSCPPLTLSFSYPNP